MELSIEKIAGGYYQATREKYNLLDFNVTQNSKVTVNEDGTININGTGGFTLAFKKITAKANTKYYIKWELVSGTVDTSKSGGNSFLDPLDSKNIKQGEFKESVVETDKDISGFWINNMTVFTNAVIKFWANTDKNDSEQYGVSPSPDYPSEIETVGSNVNLFDKDNVNKLSGYIDKSGHLQYDTNNKIIYVKCEANTDYVISSKNIRGVAFLNKVPKIGLESTNFKILTTTELTLNSKENTYLACWYYSLKLSLTEQEILNSIKIEKGTVATAYSPYNQGSVNLSVGNKNLFNVKQTGLTSATNAGITAVLNDDNSITLNGTATNDSTIVLDSIIPYLNFVKDKTYSIFQEYISGNATNKLYSHFIFINKKGKTTWGWLNCNTQNSSGLAKKTTLGNGYSNKLCLYCVKGTTFTNYTIKLMVAEGDYTLDTILPYVDYQSQTITMPIQQEMLEGDYIKDVEHHEWGKITLNGNENEFLVTSTIGSDLIAIVFNIDKIKHYSVAKIICDMFTTKILGSVTDINNKNNVRFFEGIAKHSNEDSLQVVISIKRNRLESEDLDGVKKWLRINKPTVYYQLATPTNLELTAEQKAIREQKLYTYKNITNIAVSDELSSIDVMYKKDQNTVNNKLQSQINELKELLSTTQTSALLLDNLQKDVESEV